MLWLLLLPTLWLLLLLLLWLLLLLLLWLLLLLLQIMSKLSADSFIRWSSIAPSASSDACCRCKLSRREPTGHGRSRSLRTAAWLRGCAAARLCSCGMTSG